MSDYSLLVYRNTVGCCISLLFPARLLTHLSGLVALSVDSPIFYIGDHDIHE